MGEVEKVLNKLKVPIQQGRKDCFIKHYKGILIFKQFFCILDFFKEGIGVANFYNIA